MGKAGVRSIPERATVFIDYWGKNSKFTIVIVSLRRSGLIEELRTLPMFPKYKYEHL